MDLDTFEKVLKRIVAADTHNTITLPVADVAERMEELIDAGNVILVQGHDGIVRSAIVPIAETS